MTHIKDNECLILNENLVHGKVVLVNESMWIMAS
jgi:hypothetical protein